MCEYFINYIGENYNEIKSKFKQLLYNNFNEDIFHNTIYKCYESINKNNIHFNNDIEIIKYFYASFKMNLLRSKLYSDNKPKDDISLLNNEIPCSIEDICDIHIIHDKIISKFGMDMCNAFIEHISGNTINNLQNKYSHIKNIKLKIKQIKLYIISEL